ncbi:MAG: hypothetical protein ACRDQA_31970, partial [Nocardioidaceae bacterium]
EAAMLRTPASCFPYASDPDPKVDIDHTIAYQHHPPGDEGGKAPPGQTAMTNLGGLTRRHHRDRPHGGWHGIQIRSGMWLWISPHHRSYLVDNLGTTRLGKLWN